MNQFSKRPTIGQKKYFYSLLLPNVRSFHEWGIVFRLAFRNLKTNKMRTVLTVLGIVIGITAVIIVMAGGAGLKNYVMGQVDVFGSDYIQIEPKVPGVSDTSSQNISGRSTGLAITTLKIADGEEIAKLPNVAAWNAGNIDQEIAVYKNINKRSLIFGYMPGALAIDRQLVIEEGNFFTEGENASAEQVAVIGSGVRDSLFGEEDPIGKSVKIKSQSYRVIGLAKKRGAGGFFNLDDAVYVPVNTLNKKLLGIDYVQFITVQLKDMSLVTESEADIRDTLRRRHDIIRADKEDFAITSSVEAKDMINNVFGTINYLLLALTSISLLVGGVGIMNVMYVAVTERTREIGLRKALGAKNSSILRQFLFEAVIVTILGGAVGVIFGIAATYFLNSLLVRLGFLLQFSVPISTIVVAVGFSAAVGVIFGIYPAWKASQLSPIEALRK
ncbi:MAG TPA: ABC transporter permease [Candidatus Saccharimonadales bacterium]|nr:ABC transporter permease [Candidatus Saccharimonadales bacterium]